MRVRRWQGSFSLAVSCAGAGLTEPMVQQATPSRPALVAASSCTEVRALSPGPAVSGHLDLFHGSGCPQSDILRELGGNCMAFCDLASKVTWGHSCWAKSRGDKPAPMQGEGNPLHLLGNVSKNFQTCLEPACTWNGIGKKRTSVCHCIQ